jgi:hypothetical protein
MSPKGCRNQTFLARLAPYVDRLEQQVFFIRRKMAICAYDHNITDPLNVETELEANLIALVKTIGPTENPT